MGKEKKIIESERETNVRDFSKLQTLAAVFLLIQLVSRQITNDFIVPPNRLSAAVALMLTTLPLTFSNTFYIMSRLVHLGHSTAFIN